MILKELSFQIPDEPKIYFWKLRAVSWLIAIFANP